MSVENEVFIDITTDIGNMSSSVLDLATFVHVMMMMMMMMVLLLLLLLLLLVLLNLK
jgi:hypothetical protein